MVTLRPLRDDEYDAWDAAHRTEYERGLVEFAGMTREAARAKVTHDVAAILPDRLVILRVMRPAEGVDAVKEAGPAVTEVAERVKNLS